MEYQYTPLGARSIRLLRLLPGTGADVLTGGLVTTSLDNVPEFTALSYAWGCLEPRKAIYLDGFKATTGPGLHSALKHLRRADQPILLWADALCINQADIPERTQQVKMMGDVYAAAWGTVIWLGEESPEVVRAFGHLRRVGEAFLESVVSDPPTPQEGSGFIAGDRVKMVLRQALSNNQSQAFRDVWALLERPWFARKWIIQELVKSQTPILMAGRNYLSWRFLSCWLTMHRPDPRRTPTPPAVTLYEAESKMLAPKQLRATILARTAAAEKQPLLHLLATTLEFRCKDVRDHVFALVGIASDADNFDLIDYNERIGTVCQRLAYASVSESANLKLLWYLAHLTSLDRRVHSWVPNLDNLVTDGDGGVLSCLFTLFEHREQRASGDSVLDTRLDKGRNTLTIRGRIVDKLQRLGSSNRRLSDARLIGELRQRHDHPDSAQGLARDLFQWVEECIDIAQSAGRGKNTAEKAFRGALLYGCLPEGKGLSMAETLERELSEQLCLLKIAGYDSAGCSPAARIRMLGLRSTRLLEHITSDRLNRRFGRTEKDKIGWLPPVAEEGDLICIFHGMELPYAIRPADHGGYQLVGECIIMGLMRGEGMDLPDLESEMIVLT
ncbi:hypothetical protein RB595_000125 [Gaeumannomyces hyphopodioides]